MSKSYLGSKILFTSLNETKGEYAYNYTKIIRINMPFIGIIVTIIYNNTPCVPGILTNVS